MRSGEMAAERMWGESRGRQEERRWCRGGWEVLHCAVSTTDCLMRTSLVISSRCRGVWLRHSILLWLLKMAALWFSTSPLSLGALVGSHSAVHKGLMGPISPLLPWTLLSLTNVIPLETLLLGRKHISSRVNARTCFCFCFCLIIYRVHSLHDYG